MKKISLANILSELEVKDQGPKSSDVKALIKLVDSNPTLKSKLQTVNNAAEVTEFLSYILNTINPKVTGVSKANLIKIINNRFK
jgi:hypothetical protein